MAHTIQDTPRIIARIRRIKGQADAVERALEAEASCHEVLMLVASMRGAINGLITEVIERHIEHHVADPTDPARAKGAEELISVLRSYLK
jgi:DNA-binding FrmR family transcriptional regulator